MNKPPAQPYLTITPLGGLGEIGMNCQMWDSPEGVILVDCGIMFPDELQLGVDVVLPALAPILEQRERLLGVVLTHGHEDHIGAIPWLVTFISGLRIYGSPFTLALIKHKLRERALLDRCELIPIFPETDLLLGSFRIQCIPVSHSIPQGYALAIDTPVGKIVHSGDFKIDPYTEQGIGTNIETFRKFAGPQGVRLLLSDSTNAESSGHTLPEKLVKEEFEKIFTEAQGRIITTLFSSHIDRIQTVFDMARKTDRPVLVSGRSLTNNIEHANGLNFLRMPPSFITDQNMPDVLPKRLALVATGSQGEPLSALARIAGGTHKHIMLTPDDTIIMSSRVIPGNARAVNRLINQFYKAGATVYHVDMRLVHVSGHAKQDELTAMIEAVRPQNFVPIHGEYRHLVEHTKLAQRCGVPPENTFLLTNGEPITITKDEIIRETPIPVESLLVDGKIVGDVGSFVLRERQLLGGDGVVVVNLILDGQGGEILHGPSVISRGFVFEKSHDYLLEDAKCLILDILEEEPRPSIARMHDRIRSALRSFFRRVIGRDPIVVPVITEL